MERDRDATGDFLSFLDSRSAQPFFALLFYDSPHKFAFAESAEPVFQPSARDINYLTLGNETDVRPLLNRYRNSVHYVDNLIGEVLAGLAARNLLDDSIIVVTGDHGQEFNDTRRNYWCHTARMNVLRFQDRVLMSKPPRFRGLRV